MKKLLRLKQGTPSLSFQLMSQVDSAFLGHGSSQGLRQMVWLGDWII